MEIPWMVRNSAEGEVVVMASKFHLTTAWRSPIFLLYALRLWRQALRSPGVLGVSLRAAPLQGTFWTLSAWTDKKALYAYAKTGPHSPAMKKIRPWMKDSTFRFWTADAASLPAPAKAATLWKEAETHLATPESHP